MVLVLTRLQAERIKKMLNRAEILGYKNDDEYFARINPDLITSRLTDKEYAKCRADERKLISEATVYAKSLGVTFEDRVCGCGGVCFQADDDFWYEYDRALKS